MRGFVAFAPIGGLLATASAIPWKRADNVTVGPFSVNDFANITVSKELSWIECFDEYLCANLEVPLDYADEKAGTTNIAFIKYQGGDGSGPDIIFNPGGPGGSGVDTVRGAGSVLLENFGGNYNIIGFDPRGVNNSGPTLTCFPEDPETRSLFNLRISGIHNVPAGERYQQARAYGERCSRVNADSAAKYVGTSAVAQDLKHFIELSAVDKGQKAEDAKFYYYGVSYGTVIGQTIAAMYPDKIERMMLDGNVYAEEYYQGNVRSSIGDTDDTVRSFFTYCAEAGPEKCVFASENATADDLEARYKNILQKLEDEPLVISGLDQPLPGIVTRPNLEAFTFRNTYRPRTQFPLLAKVFSEIDIGNSSTYNLAQSGGGAAAIGLEEDSGYYSDVPNPDYAMSEALGLITCVDVAGRYKVTRQDYIRLYRELKESSYYGGGPMSMGNALACAGFEINPPESQYFPGFKETKTKTPILFINTFRDPVTPYSSAVKASKFFPGSAVLAQDTTGHGFMTVPSNCTLGYIKSYWEKAELPKEGTICEGDVKPLVDPPTDDLVEVEVEEEDVEVPTRAKRGLERGNEIVY